MFLFPFFPDDLLCSVAGILPISWLGFFLMLVVTRATSAGGTILFMSGEIIPFHGWGLIVFGIVGVVGIAAFIICFKHSAKINEWYEGLLYKISNWKIFRRKNGEKESADERSSQEK